MRRLVDDLDASNLEALGAVGKRKPLTWMHPSLVPRAARVSEAVCAQGGRARGAANSPPPKGRGLTQGLLSGVGAFRGWVDVAAVWQRSCIESRSHQG
jgi:hypothetical protein